MIGTFLIALPLLLLTYFLGWRAGSGHVELRASALAAALRPFARMAVADERMAGMTPDEMRSAVANARKALAIRCSSEPSQADYHAGAA